MYSIKHLRVRLRNTKFLIENSLFGVDSGAAMVKYGNNTFYAAPTIFKAKGYTSAVFHGNTSTFWNRNKAYKVGGMINFIPWIFITIQKIK